MDELRIIEGNKMIAEFMGYKPKKCNNGFAWDIGESLSSKNHILPIQGRLITKDCNYLLFNSDWNWLMGVVEEIEGIEDENRCRRYNVQIEQDWCSITDMHRSDLIVEVDGRSKIEAVYAAVVRFVFVCILPIH